MSIEYGQLAVGDADRCGELESILFPGDDPWPAVAFIRELDADHNNYVAARDGRALIGYGGISRLGRKAPYEYEIHTIGVDPEYQGRGVGRAMLDRLLAIADGDTVYLEVRTDNTPAIGLYESTGFVKMGVRKRYYRISGADAYTMRRVGTPPASGGDS